MSRHTDRETEATSVILELDFQGDEIAEQMVRIKRRVWADDPTDLSSSLHYEVTEQLEGGEPAGPDGPTSRRPLDGCSP